MESGYVKLWRKTVHSEIWTDPILFYVASWCLMRASYCERVIPMTTGRGVSTVKIGPGQFVTGRHQAAKELRLPPSTIRNKLSRLGTIDFLDIQTDTHWSVISIKNWATYQEVEDKEGQAIGQPKDRQRTGKGHKQEGKEWLEGKEEKQKHTRTSAKRPALATRPAEVSEQVWSDFLALRKTKRAPFTETALSGICRESEKAGLSLQCTLEMCCQRGWQGFRAEWYDGNGRKGGVNALAL